MASTKPYLLRAIYQWAEDNQFTAQVLVDALYPGVEVPEQHITEGRIVLNVASSAILLHVMDNDCLNFSARFNGVEEHIFLPMEAILAIFARESSQGMFFEEAGEETLNPKTLDGQVKSKSNLIAVDQEIRGHQTQKVETIKNGDANSRQPKKRRSHHLKIIK